MSIRPGPDFKDAYNKVSEFCHRHHEPYENSKDDPAVLGLSLIHI